MPSHSPLKSSTPNNSRYNLRYPFKKQKKSKIDKRTSFTPINDILYFCHDVVFCSKHIPCPAKYNGCVVKHNGFSNEVNYRIIPMLKNEDHLRDLIKQKLINKNAKNGKTYLFCDDGYECQTCAFRYKKFEPSEPSDWSSLIKYKFIPIGTPFTKPMNVKIVGDCGEYSDRNGKLFKVDLEGVVDGIKQYTAYVELQFINYPIYQTIVTDLNTLKMIQ